MSDSLAFCNGVINVLKVSIPIFGVNMYVGEERKENW